MKLKDKVTVRQEKIARYAKALGIPFVFTSWIFYLNNHAVTAGP
jgi:hypothetical protein